MSYLALTPEHFQELDAMARTLAGRVIEVQDYRNSLLDEKTFAAIPWMTTDVILDMHATPLRGSYCGGIFVKNMIDVDLFRTTARPEMDWGAIPEEDIYRFLILHEIGHCLNNYDYDWWLQDRDSEKGQLYGIVRGVNEVLADRYAWEALYPGKPFPVKRGRKAAIKELMGKLDGHFKMKDLKNERLPVDPAKYVPAAHEKHGIPFVTPESLERGDMPCTEYLRPWEDVMELVSER